MWSARMWQGANGEQKGHTILPPLQNHEVNEVLKGEGKGLEVERLLGWLPKRKVRLSCQHAPSSRPALRTRPSTLRQSAHHCSLVKAEAWW